MVGSLIKIAQGLKPSKDDGTSSNHDSVGKNWEANSDKASTLSGLWKIHYQKLSALSKLHQDLSARSKLQHQTLALIQKNLMEIKAKYLKENIFNRCKSIEEDDINRPLENVKHIQPCPDLIVKLTFKYGSCNITDTPAESLNGKREKNKLCFGSGRITNVRNVANLGLTCNCRTCKNSTSPKNICGEVWIKTAVSKFFDKCKDGRITCDAFCYSKDSHCSTEKMEFYDIMEFSKDSSTLAFLTCDTKLYHRLQVILNRNRYLNQYSDNQMVQKQKDGMPRDGLLNIENYIEKNIYSVNENLAGERASTENKQMFLILQFLKVADCITKQEPAIELDTSFTNYETDISSETEEKILTIHIANFNISKITEAVKKSISDYDASKEKRTMKEINRFLKKRVKHGETVQFGEKLSKCVIVEFTILKNIEISTFLEEDLNNLVEKELKTLEQEKAMKSLQGKQKDQEKEFKSAKEEQTFQIHQKCIDILSFTMKDLPECYQHKEMEDLILSLADLTVFIQVKRVRKETAKTWQGATASFSIFNSADAEMGTGKVDDVFIYRNNQKASCRCNKCKVSELPSKDWGEVRIVTSAQLVKGDNEAKRTTCTLFYDSETSLESRRFIHGDRIVVLNIDTDLCKFMCITCDLELLTKLDKKVDTFVDSWEKAFDKYVELEDCENEKLAVIVSHPFGLRKHVSIGKWTEKMIEAQKVKRFRYDAPTYPGSRGAFVLMPSFKDFDDLPHFKC